VSGGYDAEQRMTADKVAIAARNNAEWARDWGGDGEMPGQTVFSPALLDEPALATLGCRQ
jgi:hypothetical protein